MKQTAVDWLIEQLNKSGLDQVVTEEEIKHAKKMEKEQQKQMLIGLLDWMNKVAQDNPMAFETDLEDIVNMYLEAYYTEEK